VHRRGRHHIIIDYCESCKEFVQRTLGIIEFETEAKLRRDRDFKGFEEKQRVEVTSQRLNLEELMSSILAGSH
jgi:hypothetical protein